MTGENIGFADPLVAKEAVGRLGVGPVLTCPRRGCTYFMRQLLEQLSHKVGATTPWACQDWANTKAAYRFFGNERISESNILAGHFACTRERFSARCVSEIDSLVQK